MSGIRWAAALTALGSLCGQVVLNPPRDASVISVDVDLVNVLCSVRDRNGAYVKDLTRDDFEIREDGRRQEIRLFAREVDSPLTVALLLDVSGSVMRIIQTEKATAGRFFAEVLRPSDNALLVGFAHLIAVWQDLTSSVAQLEDAVDRAGPGRLRLPLDRLDRPAASRSSAPPEHRPRGTTLLYDAVNLVATNKLKKQPGRKTMVIISDGLDNGSSVSIKTATQVAQEADAVVYAIHCADPTFSMRVSRRGLATLEKLSQPTGGRMFQIEGETTLETIFNTIREEMRSQYGIGYRSSNTAMDGRFRRLEVKATRPGLRVHARSGYYAVRR